MYYYTVNDKCSILFTLISVDCAKIIFSHRYCAFFRRNLSLVFNLTLNVRYFCCFILPCFYLLLKIKKIKQKLILLSTSALGVIFSSIRYIHLHKVYFTLLRKIARKQSNKPPILYPHILCNSDERTYYLAVVI